jgi:hypothetical protein
MSWWWRSKNKNSQDHDQEQAFVQRLADVNAFCLQAVYQKQLAVAAECRRGRLSCVEAIAALRDRRRSSADRLFSMHQAFLQLRRAIERSHTAEWFKARVPSFFAARESLVELIELVESPEAAADAAARQAELDRAALASDLYAPGVRALAEDEAKALRERDPERVDVALRYARVLVGTSDVVEAAEAAASPPEVEAARMLRFGYVRSAWRGIEDRLPEGSVEVMIDALDRVARAG